MTTLDPSHLPFRHDAQAVHRAHPSSSSASPQSATFPDDLPEVTAKDEARGHSRARKEGRKRVKNAMPPMPDLRFEQSYLLSIRPFLKPRPDRATKAEKGPVPDEKDSKTLVQSADNDEVFHWGREVDVDWRSVSWVTFRDQVMSPLFQGALWGWATLFLSVSGTVLRSSLYPASHINKGRIAGGPGGGISQAGGGDAVGGTGWWRSWVGSWFGAVETATV
ncbi:hypothetical protein CI109_100233 [Kwoniella shandongensis]|uniref:Uncharacterized protein n=1 Tax=Kwoniella shandongensis TaxID=1734106 RepID=A0A5M6BRA1_9TREE|nr:uncharacterized protein CI109_006232 [Kwoniella shandongensis]KAA5525428.1 hypothetical protein CI109_006232 [Kwoniella shandongensis]